MTVQWTDMSKVSRYSIFTHEFTSTLQKQEDIQYFHTTPRLVATNFNFFPTVKTVIVESMSKVRWLSHKEAASHQLTAQFITVLSHRPMKRTLKSGYLMSLVHETWNNRAIGLMLKDILPCALKKYNWHVSEFERKLWS